MTLHEIHSVNGSIFGYSLKVGALADIDGSLVELNSETIQTVLGYSHQSLYDHNPSWSVDPVLSWDQLKKAIGVRSIFVHMNEWTDNGSEVTREYDVLKV